VRHVGPRGGGGGGGPFPSGEAAKGTSGAAEEKRKRRPLPALRQLESVTPLHPHPTTRSVPTSGSPSLPPGSHPLILLFPSYQLALV